jgi:hypothetical protein
MSTGLLVSDGTVILNWDRQKAKSVNVENEKNKNTLAQKAVLSKVQHITIQPVKVLTPQKTV